MNTNPLLMVDVYKMGHMEQFAPGCTKIYSYLTTRSDKTFDKVVWFGLQYYLKEYLSMKLTPSMGEEFLKYRSEILGIENNPEIVSKIKSLCNLGFFPLKIKALPEGSVVPKHVPLFTMAETIPGFHWVVGFVESMLLKVWYPSTVASCSFKYRQLVNRYFSETCDGSVDFLRNFTVHDFGYRGDSSEEGAAISGAAHLLSFLGSDTVPALPFVYNYYTVSNDTPVMLSVPASEHSVMCSFGKEDELAAFRHMLDLYPTGIVSIVSDTYDVYKVLTEFATTLKPQIMSREGKVVFRPDSGNPEHIICGDPDALEGSNEWLGAIRLLDNVFGHTVNEKGYKVLDSHVGLIYGDGMYYERYERALARMKEAGYAACNLVIGVGGILRNHSRDTLGFALKATYVEINGEPVEIEKTPVTDPGKRSAKGLLRVEEGRNGYEFFDQQTKQEEVKGLLVEVFRDGKLVNPTTFTDVRTRVGSWLAEDVG